VVALAVTTLVLPDRARLRLRDGLAQEFLVLGAFFEAIMQGFRGAPQRTWRRCATMRWPCCVETTNCWKLRGANIGWSGMARGIGNAFAVWPVVIRRAGGLEFSVKETGEYCYAQQLEPALGQLTVDIHTGFSTWRPAFMNGDSMSRTHEPRGGHCAARIADDGGAAHGIGFSQAEILRAYAVHFT